jgi:putative nucleotidyltransferase with HDIG domain
MPPFLDVENLIQSIDRLPDLPIVAVRVNRMLNDSDVNALELSRVISLDTGLTTKILKLCNSSAYGLPRKIATVKEAITILGLKELRQVLFTIISRSILNRSFEGYALSKDALWENAIVCASCAKVIAERIRFQDKDLVFTAALLRDIGKLALDMAMQKQFLAVERQALQEKLSFEQAEYQTLGVSHAEVGARLAENWSLPEALVATIRYHHNPSAMPTTIDANIQRLVALVHLADCYTAMLGVGIGSDGLMYSVDPKALEIIGLPQSALQELFIEVMDQPEMVRETLESLESAL